MLGKINTLAQLDAHFDDIEKFMGRGLAEYSGLVTMERMEEGGEKYLVCSCGSTSYRVNLATWSNPNFRRSARIEVKKDGIWVKGWTMYPKNLREFVQYMSQNLRINNRDKLAGRVLEDNAFPYTFVTQSEIRNFCDRSVPFADVVKFAADRAYELIQSECK